MSEAGRASFSPISLSAPQRSKFKLQKVIANIKTHSNARDVRALLYHVKLGILESPVGHTCLYKTRLISDTLPIFACNQ